MQTKTINIEEFKKILKTVVSIRDNKNNWIIIDSDDADDLLFIERRGYGVVFKCEDNQIISYTTEETKEGKQTFFYLKSKYDGCCKIQLIAPIILE